MPGIAILYLWLMGQRKAVLWCTATVVLSMSLLITFRYLYYGYPLPNTFYAKIDGSLTDRLTGAWVQFKNILFEKGLFLYLMIFIAGAIWALIRMIFRKPSLSAASGFSLFLFFFWLAYWFYVGGDVFVDRFLIILFPLGMFICWDLIRYWTTNCMVYILTFLTLLGWQLSPILRDDRFKYAYPKYDMWVDLGKFIGERYPGKVLAAGGVGKIPFYSRLTTIDMLGLCDVKIGHEKVKKFIVGHSKFNPEYVLSRKPDLIALWIDHRMNYEFWFPPKQSEAYGYRLKYLVYANNLSCGKDIIKADSFTNSQIKNLWSKGYRYAVLEKVVSGNIINPDDILAH
jgi:arabinofuranosyltransferase